MKRETRELIRHLQEMAKRVDGVFVPDKQKLAVYDARNNVPCEMPAGLDAGQDLLTPQSPTPERP